MSHPRQLTPSQSPTPSKSSLRRTSGTQNPSQRGLIPPPSPRFEDQPAVAVRYSPRSPPNQTLEYESDEDDEPLLYPEPPPADGADDSYFPDAEPERPFQPLFTLIEDVLTSEHHHPTVHYLFADDDAEIITEAALRSLEQDDLDTSSTTGEGAQTQAGNADNDSSNVGRLPPTPEGTKEHYLILNVAPISHVHGHGPAQPRPHSSQAQAQSQSQATPQPDFIPSYTVTSYTSLSPEWQITSASITSAPTMGDGPGDGEDEGLMLRIEGRGIESFEDLAILGADTPGKAFGQAGQGEERGRENLEDMIERFQSRLGEVRRLIEIDSGGSGAGSGGGNVYRGIGIGITTTGPSVEGPGSHEHEHEHDGGGIGYGLEEQD